MMKPLEKSLKLNVNKALAERCKRSFYFFLTEFWDEIIPDAFVDNWHVKVLCDELQIVSERVFKRQQKEYDLIINVPPGTSKSTICTIMFPVWCWTRDSSLRFITGSYSIGLSTDHAVKSRDIIRSDKFKLFFPDIKIKEDSDNKTAYINTEGGDRVSTSVGGTITGKHAHILIVDDPIKPSDSESELLRTTANDWFDKTLSTRKVDKAVTPTILIMQRLHQKDPTGYLLSKKGSKVRHICLPAEISKDVSPAILKDNYVGGVLDINRLSPEILSDMKTSLGSYGYSGQMQQTPTPDGGGIIKSAWFPITKDIPNVKSDLFIDGAFTDKTYNDPTGIMEAVHHGNNMIILQSLTKHLELYELIAYIKEYTNSRPNFRFDSSIFIEEKASGSGIKSLLKQAGFNVVSLDNKFVAQGKITRAAAAQPIVEAGRVLLAEGHWNQEFLNQVDGFPNAEHDEHVDNLTAMVNRYTSGFIKAPKYNFKK